MIKKAKPAAASDEIDPGIMSGVASAGELVASSETVTAMAESLGYDGPLSVGALEDGIRFYQHRTIESLLEMGKRLLLLKEITPHGEFAKRVAFLGFSYPTANRFMSAAAKTAKSLNLRDLSTQVKNASAFLELITHDEDTLKGLAELDDIDRLSASELRARVRALEAEGHEDAVEARKRANRIQAQLEKSEDLLETLKSAREVNPAFDLETNIVREQAALLDGHAAAALDLLDKMADALAGEAVGEGEFKARFHCVWFSAHAVYGRTLVLLERLREMGDGCLPESLDEFGAGIFSRNEAQHYLAELTALRTALGKRSDKIRQDAEDNAPRKAGRPKGSKNKTGE